MRIARAAIAYFAIIFALGFVLGTIRVLWLAPQVGETAASFAEIPLMLCASWFVARWLVSRHDITDGLQALAMGALAFAFLMVAELALGLTLFNMTAREWIANVTATPGLYGLIGQIVFGLIPWLSLKLAR